VIGRQEMLAPVLDPFDGTIELARDRRDQEVLRVEFTANPEAAPRVRDLHDDGGFRKIEHGREHFSVEERDLGDPEHGHALLVRIPLGGQAPRLHRNSGVALNGEALAPHVICRSERCFDVTSPDFGRGRVRSGALMNQNRALGGPRPVQNRRQVLDLRRNQ
jgi:hypothetical protein